MLSIPVWIASGAHNGYYVKLPVMITVLTMRVIIRCTHTMILQKPCHYVNGQSYQSREQPRYLRIIIRMRSIPISSAWQHSCRTSTESWQNWTPLQIFLTDSSGLCGKSQPLRRRGGGQLKNYVVYEALFRQGVYYGMKPSSGDDICGCDICWKARYDGTPGGAGVVLGGEMCGGIYKVREVRYDTTYVIQMLIAESVYWRDLYGKSMI